MAREAFGRTADFDPSAAAPPPAPAPTPVLTTASGPRLVTAIISTYASEMFMRGCLQDLVDQTLYAQGALEIVVIDSGSPQGEGAIVRDFQARYPRIRYLRTERETLYAAWNRAIAMSDGHYLTNANTDDRHAPDALEKLARCLDQHPEVGVAYADQRISHSPNQRFAECPISADIGWSPREPFEHEELQLRYTMGSQPMWRKSLHQRHGLFDARFTSAGDYDFFLRIAPTEGFLHVPEVLGLYYWNRQGIEHSSNRAEEELKIVRQNHGITRQSIGAIHVRRGNYHNAAVWYAAVLEESPADKEALRGVARCFLELKDLPAARRVYDILLRLDPGDAVAREGLARVIREQQPTLAA
jgi:glycosyltransferase involved in cell wall biosynthesis